MSKAKCGPCQTKRCREGADCLGTREAHEPLYEDEQIRRLHKAASAIEARHYCQEPRIVETILFAKELGLKRVGLAFCVGLAEEAAVIEKALSRHFEVVSVCCKVSGIGKSTLELEQIDPDKPLEVMCNPAGQAQILNEAETELNILCGLCIGHDAIFGMTSEAPVTTMVVKDRVLAHNPVGAVYCQYLRRRVVGDENE